MKRSDAFVTLSRIEADVAALKALLTQEIADADDERPIAIKRAAHEFGVNERTMRRYAEQGGGVKVRGRWYVYASQIILPRLSANVR